MNEQKVDPIIIIIDPLKDHPINRSGVKKEPYRHREYTDIYRSDLIHHREFRSNKYGC